MDSQGKWILKGNGFLREMDSQGNPLRVVATGGEPRFSLPWFADMTQNGPRPLWHGVRHCRVQPSRYFV